MHFDLKINNVTLNPSQFADRRVCKLHTWLGDTQKTAPLSDKTRRNIFCRHTVHQIVFCKYWSNVIRPIKENKNLLSSFYVKVWWFIQNSVNYLNLAEWWNITQYGVFKSAVSFCTFEPCMVSNRRSIG